MMKRAAITGLIALVFFSAVTAWAGDDYPSSKEIVNMFDQEYNRVRGELTKPPQGLVAKSFTYSKGGGDVAGGNVKGPVFSSDPIPADPPVIYQTFPNILFNFDSASIKQASYSLLDNIADALIKMSMREKKKINRVDIIGHTDILGGDGYNLELSDKRAAAVKNYLEYLNVALPIRYKGMGKRKPLPELATVQHPYDRYNEIIRQAPNRRVEIGVTYVD